MLFLVLGVVLLLLKWQSIGPIAAWDWWVILAPFGLVAAWWTWADFSGLTKRKAVEREDARKQARIEKSKAAMRLGPRARR